MKKHHRLLASTFAIALASFAYSATPPEILSPADKAMAKVNADIYLEISPPSQPFSRVMPVERHVLQFQPQILVDGETHLPFVIRKFAPEKDGTLTVQFKGYVRLEDQEIYLHDPKINAYFPASEHPRFAPKKIRIATPSKPG